MPDKGSEVIHEGANWVLGRDSQGYGVWPKLQGLRLEGEPAARFAATPDGLASASHLLSSWDSIPVPPSPTSAVALTEARSRWWWPSLAGVAFLIIVGVTALIVVLSQSGKSLPTADSVLSNPTQSPTAQPPVGTGYLSTNSSEAVFIQWNQSGSSVSGTAQVDYVQGAPPNETLSTNTINLSGVLNGNDISLSFNGGVQEFGTLSDGSFTLNFPQQDGSLAPVTFDSSDPSSFNSAVASLHTQVQVADTNAAEAQRQAQQESATNSAISAVNSDIAALNHLVSIR